MLAKEEARGVNALQMYGRKLDINEKYEHSSKVFIVAMTVSTYAVNSIVVGQWCRADSRPIDIGSNCLFGCFRVVNEVDVAINMNTDNEDDILHVRFPFGCKSSRFLGWSINIVEPRWRSACPPSWHPC